MAKARLTVEDVQEMGMEEIARRLKRAGWEPVNGSFKSNGIPTTFAITVNVNEYTGPLICEFLANIEPGQGEREDIIKDPLFITYELNINEKSGQYYFWSLDDNPNNALVYEDFYHDAEAFSFVVLWILKDKFITKMETALADIWATVRETDDGKGSVPNRYLTLAQAKEEWSGLVLNGEEETCVDIGDYAIIAQENKENSPKTYYLINEKLAEKVMEAKDDAKAFEIMGDIIEEMEAKRYLVFNDYERA